MSPYQPSLELREVNDFRKVSHLFLEQPPGDYPNFKLVTKISVSFRYLTATVVCLKTLNQARITQLNLL